MKEIKIPKIYIKLLCDLMLLSILCLLPVMLNVFITDIKALSMPKCIYITISYIILIGCVELMIKIYKSIFLLFNFRVKQDYYKIKIKLPKLIKKESNIGKYK